MKLDELNMDLRKETGFVKHLKKLDEKNQAEYEEDQGPKRRSSMKKPGSPSRYSPDASPSMHRGSIISKRETFKGFKKLDMSHSRYSSLSPANMNR